MRFADLCYDIMTPLIQDWISMKEMTVLNSATCNHDDRISFHEVVNVQIQKYNPNLLYKRNLFLVRVYYPVTNNRLVKFVPFLPRTLSDYALLDFQTKEALSFFAIYSPQQSCSALSAPLCRYEDKKFLKHYSSESTFQTGGGMCAIFYSDGPYVGEVDKEWRHNGHGILFSTTHHNYNHAYHRKTCPDHFSDEDSIQMCDEFYSGEWIQGWEVKGLRTFWNGDIYEGDWKWGLPEGMGVMRYLRSGDVYEGEWKYGSPHGKGTLKWQGEWSHGEKNPKKLTRFVIHVN